MKIIISNVLEIQQPTKDILDYCKKVLTISNPEYEKKKHLGFWLGKTPRTIKLYEKYNDNIYLPIGCFSDIFNIHPKIEDYTDYTSVSKRNIQSNIILRSYQEPCINAVKKYMTGILLLPAGTGKTQIALQCASELKQHTLFLTHTKELLNQAKQRCEDNLVCSTSTITEGKCDSSGDIVFATVQTLSNVIKNDNIKQNELGMIIVDECHHLATNAESVTMFETCINYFNARYKIGLTATLSRSDGLQKTTEKILGNVIYELRKEKNNLVGYYDGNEVVRVPLEQFQVPAIVYMKKTQYKPSDECFDVTDRVVYTKLISDLTSNFDRNKLILETCKNLQGYSIVVSERVDQLKWFEERLSLCARIDSKMKKKDREEIVQDFRSGRYKYLLATYSLIAEGFDVPMLENIVMASPIKDRKTVIQSVGRCQRPYGHKKLAKVYDFDDDVSILKGKNGAFNNRRITYKKEGWEMIYV